MFLFVHVLIDYASFLQIAAGSSNLIWILDDLECLKLGSLNVLL